MRCRRVPSNWNGLVTMPTVRHAEFLGDARDHRRSTRPRAAAHARRDEQHVRAGDVPAQFLDRLFGSRFADLRPRSRAETFGEIDAELNAAFRARRRQRLRVGVRHHELDPGQPGRDHVVDGIAAGAADADHRQSGPQIHDPGKL